MNKIAEFFATSEEALAAFPFTGETDAFIDAVYLNVLGRAPDDAGRIFWKGALDDGNVSRGSFVLEILNGVGAGTGSNTDPGFVAQSVADQQYLDNKTDIGIYFSAILGMSDVANANDVMNRFDGSSESFIQARDATFNYYLDAVDADGTGEFLVQFVGIVDNPFA